MSSKCRYCNANQREYDRQQLCSMCKDIDCICIYGDEDGILSNSFNATNYPESSSNGAEFNDCRRQGRRRSGTKPCYRQVKHREKLSCIYYKASREKESFDPRAFTLNKDQSIPPGIKAFFQEII